MEGALGLEFDRALLGANRLGTAMRDLKVKVVGRHGAGEEIAENTNRVILTEDEVGQTSEAASYAHKPKRDRHGWFPGCSRGPHLNQPTSREQEHARVAYDFPTGDLYSTEFY